MLLCKNNGLEGKQRFNKSPVKMHTLVTASTGKVLCGLERNANLTQTNRTRETITRQTKTHAGLHLLSETLAHKLIIQ